MKNSVKFLGVPEATILAKPQMDFSGKALILSIFSALALGNRLSKAKLGKNILI